MSEKTRGDAGRIAGVTSARRQTWIAPAKVNLTLEVLGRRPDGYHDIRTAFQAIDLADRLTIEATGGEGLSLRCDAPGVPTDDRNLVVRAWSRLRARRAFPGGARVSLEKRVPMGAGLGGGSSDAAALLAAAADLFALGLADDDLEAIGAEIGSDVAFFIRGGTRLGEGRGEILGPLPALRTGAFVILTPPRSLRTADVYAAGRFGLTPAGDAVTILRLGLTREEPQEVARALVNALEKAAFSLYPELDGLKGKLLGRGALGALMCGSGSSLFAFFASADDARRASEDLAADGHEVRLALPLDHGVRRVA